MKKILAVLLVLLMSAILFVGCSGGETSTNNEQTNKNDVEDTEIIDFEGIGLPKGIQTLTVSDIGLEVKIDADGLSEFCNSFSGFNFNDELTSVSFEFIAEKGGKKFAVNTTIQPADCDNIADQIDLLKNRSSTGNINFEENEQIFINDVLMYVYTLSFSNIENDKSYTSSDFVCYYIPTGFIATETAYGSSAVEIIFMGTTDREYTNEVMKKVFSGLNFNGGNGIEKDSIITLKDTSGKNICDLYLYSTPNSKINVVSNSNGNIKLEYSAKNYEEIEETYIIDMGVNKFSSKSEYFEEKGVSGTISDLEYPGTTVTKGHVYLPYGGAEEHAFAVQLEDGTLLTGTYPPEMNEDAFRLLFHMAPTKAK